MLYISDSTNQRVRAVNRTSGIITTVVGSGSSTYSGDGGLATAAGLSPSGLCFNQATNQLFITANNRIRVVNRTSNIISLEAGNGYNTFNGDGKNATTTLLNNPRNVLFYNNTLYIVDTGNQRIRVLNGTTGLISTIAGNGGVGSYSGMQISL